MEECVPGLVSAKVAATVWAATLTQSSATQQHVQVSVQLAVLYVWTDGDAHVYIHRGNMYTYIEGTSIHT